MPKPAVTPAKFLLMNRSSRHHAICLPNCLPRSVCSLVCVLVLTLGFMSQVAYAKGKQVWDDNGYGIRVTLPEAAQIVPLAKDPALVRFNFAGDVAITLLVNRLDRPVPLEKILAQAVKDAMFRYSPAVGVEDDTPNMPIAGRPSARYMLLVGDQPNKRWLYGHAITLYEPGTVLSLQIEAPSSQYNRATDLYDQVIAGVQVDNLRQTDQLQVEQLKTGQAWLEGLDPQTLNALSHGSTLQRIIQDNRDVGYRKMTLRQDRELGLEGHRLLIQSRNSGPTVRVDTINTIFLAGDKENEVWSMRYTERPEARQPANGAARLPQPKPSQRAATHTRTWTDTGVRSVDAVTDPRSGRPVRNRAGSEIRVPQIRVTREVPVAQPMGRADPLKKGSVEKLAWRVPPVGYMSQVYVNLLPWLLDADTPDMTFYAYHPGLATLTSLSVRVEPDEQTNGFTAYVRPSPRHPQQRWRYDAHGRLLEMILDQNNRIVPSNAEEIQAIWQGR